MFTARDFLREQDRVVLTLEEGTRSGLTSSLAIANPLDCMATPVVRNKCVILNPDNACRGDPPASRGPA
jgi:hypothetical protein